MTLPFPVWPPHPGAASVLDLGSCYGFINDIWVAGNSDQCHDSFLCDWLSSSKRLFWEPRLRESLPPYLVVTSHHQGRKSHQTSKSALGVAGSSSSWSLVQMGQQGWRSSHTQRTRSILHQFLLHTHHWAERPPWEPLPCLLPPVDLKPTFCFV